MAGLSHSVADFIWIVAFSLSGLLAALAGSLLVRRGVRAVASERTRKLTAVVGPWIEKLLDSSTDYEMGLSKLREHPRIACRVLLDRLASVEATSDVNCIGRLRRLCYDLGLAAQWQRQLGGQPPGGLIAGLVGRHVTVLEGIPSLSFVARAEAAENLGLIRDQRSWPLLAKALNDPSSAVRSVAVRALGRIQTPASFPILIQKLQDSALGKEGSVSLRSLKMALASFPLVYASELGAMLQHPHRRVRFLAADLVATMAQRNGNPEPPWHFPHGPLLDPIAEIFLTGLATDPNPDVRARAADVIAHLEDSRALPALLVLLEDPEWFVRLHAVRAAAELRPTPLQELGNRLTDPNWRVREATVHAVAVKGRRGVSFLLAHFHVADDRYSREQVAEEIERLGLLPSLVAVFGAPGADAETQFIKGMVRLGRTASLRAALQNAPEQKRKEVVAELQKQRELSNAEASRAPVADSGIPVLAIPGGRSRSGV